MQTRILQEAHADGNSLWLDCSGGQAAGDVIEIFFMDAPSWYRYLLIPIRDWRHTGEPGGWDAAVVIYNTIPANQASVTRLCLSDELVDAVAVKADNDLVANHNGRSAAALIGPDELLKRRRVLGHIALYERDTFLRKILFRGVAGTSAIGGKEFNSRFSHGHCLLCVGQFPWVMPRWRRRDFSNRSTARLFAPGTT
jgi:hypothetical protein